MDSQTSKCFFCIHRSVNIRYEKDTEYGDLYSYLCDICGHVLLTTEAADDFDSLGLSEIDRKTLSIYVRNEYEKNDRRNFSKPISRSRLLQIIMQNPPLSPIEKMEKVLLNLEKESKRVGYSWVINTEVEYSYYYCMQKEELMSILGFLYKDGFIDTETQLPYASHRPILIAPSGYERIIELKRKQIDSRQCFVAMWFTPKMDEVYEKAIKPAIEYVEEGKTEARFKALPINQKLHTNDINNEIIAEIRRSKFMICDLTGYRGGVYYEAGFAHGLGMEVIFTCSKDWEVAQPIEAFDNEGNDLKLKREGIHFDLKHRYRITWEPAKLKEFEKELKDFIRAYIL